MPGFHHGSRRHHFRPTLAATLAVAVALPVLLALGVWQLERGREKARLLTQAAAVQEQPPLDLGRAGSVDLIADHRPVTVRGVFLGERQGLLDNQVRDGQVGYDVLTPLRVEGLAEVLLVDRGWLARGARRSDVPVWQTPAGEVTLIGYLHRPADVPLVTGEVSDSFDGRWVVSQIDPALLGEYLGVPVQTRVLRLAPQSEHGFRRDWRLVSMTPQRHYGYAVQWFGLAGALFGIYLVAGLRRARSGTTAEER